MTTTAETWDAAVDTRVAFSFVPDLVNQELQNSFAEDTSLKPQSYQLRGICFCVEMCGFQAEIDRGLSRDAEGLSIITKMTNVFVGSLINKVYEWGGDVVEITGSALICVFVPSSNTDENIHTKALQCAWQLHEMSYEDVISVRVRMNYGDFLLGFVGGYGNQWRYLFVGQCINELKVDEQSFASSLSSGCVSHQDRGFVMSKDCYDLFQDEQNPNNNTTKDIMISAVALHTSTRELYMVQRIQVKQKTPLLGKMNSRRISLNMKALDDALNIHLMTQMFCFLPRPVIQAMLLDSLDDISDMVHITVMHVCMDGVCDKILGSMDLCILQRHVHACQEIIADVGGYISQLTVDTRGGMLVALWGIHDASITDNAQRALGAAVRIRSQLMEMKMPCSIGISSGLSYCGCLGTERRRDYIALGDVVELAADMALAIKNDISIDQLTYEEVGDPLSRHFLRQRQSETSVRINHRSRQIYPYVLRMNRLHDHHEQHHQPTNNTTASDDAVAFKDGQPGDDLIDDSYEALMSSLDGISAHDELHRMPEACQIALQQAIKQLLSHYSSSGSRNKPKSMTETDAARNPYPQPATSTTLGDCMTVTAVTTDKIAAIEVSSPSTFLSTRKQQPSQLPQPSQQLAITTIPFAKSISNATHTGAESSGVGEGDIAGHGIQEAKGVVVIEGEMGCGKEETVIWLKRVCCNRSLRVVAIKASVDGRAEDFSTIAHLFRLLVYPENFDDPVRQKELVETLLQETFPNDATTRIKVGYPAICQALGITGLLQQPPCPAVTTVTGGTSPVLNVGIGTATTGNARKSSKGLLSTKGRFLTHAAGTHGFIANRINGIFKSDSAGLRRSNSEDGNAKDGINLQDEIMPKQITPRPRTIPRPVAKPLILQAVTDIFSQLLRKQRCVVVVVEDAHEMDEQSWKLLLSLVQQKDACAYSLIVLTHELTENLTRATLASMKALEQMHIESSSFSVAEGPSKTMTNNTSPLSQRRISNTSSSFFHYNTFMRLSYEWTLDSLIQLKIAVSASGGCYLPISPPSATLVRHQLALALRTAVDRVDPSLETVVVQFCDGSSFWLREILAFILLYGLEEFLADMTGNRQHPEEMEMSSMKRKRSAPKVALLAAASLNSAEKLPSSTHLSSFIRRLSVGQNLMPPSPKNRKKSKQALDSAASVGNGSIKAVSSSNSIASDLSSESPPPPLRSSLIRGLSMGQNVLSTPRLQPPEKATIDKDTAGADVGGSTAIIRKMDRKITSHPEGASTTIPFQGNHSSKSPNIFDLALARRHQPSKQSVHDISNSPSPIPSGSSTTSDTHSVASKSRASILQISHHSIRGLGTRMSAMSAHIVNGVTQGALAMSEHGGFNYKGQNGFIFGSKSSEDGLDSCGIEGGNDGAIAIGMAAQKAVELVCSLHSDKNDEKLIDKVHNNELTKENDGNVHDAVSSNSSSPAHSGRLSASSLGLHLPNHKRVSILFDSSQQLLVLPDNSIGVLAKTNTEYDGGVPEAKLGSGKSSAFNPFRKSSKLLERKMSTEKNALLWGYTTLVASRLNKLHMDEQIVIRIAAVVGCSFRLDVLERAIPIPMRPYLSTILGTLVNCYWLTTDTQKTSGIVTHYSFCHTSVQQILYKMIPEKFRATTHLSCAEGVLELRRLRDKAAAFPSDSVPSTARGLRDWSAPPSPRGARDYLKLLMKRVKDGSQGCTTPMAFIEAGEEEVMIGMIPQHRMLFAAYHYSLSGMPPFKTVEFLCKACDKILHHNTQIPVSKVHAETAVRLICWASQLAKRVTEVVVLLALVHKCKHHVVKLWREEKDVNEGNEPSNDAAAGAAAVNIIPSHPTSPTAALLSPAQSWLCAGSTRGICMGSLVVAPSSTKSLSRTAAAAPYSSKHTGMLSSPKIQDQSVMTARAGNGCGERVVGGESLLLATPPAIPPISVSSNKRSGKQSSQIHSNRQKTSDHRNNDIDSVGNAVPPPPAADDKNNKDNNTTPLPATETVMTLVAEPLFLHQILSNTLNAVECSLEAKLLSMYQDRDGVIINGNSLTAAAINHLNMDDNDDGNGLLLDSSKQDTQKLGQDSFSRKHFLSRLFFKVSFLKPSAVDVLPSTLNQGIGSKQEQRHGPGTKGGPSIPTGTGIQHILSKESQHNKKRISMDRDPVLLGIGGNSRRNSRDRDPTLLELGIDTNCQHWKIHYQWFVLDMEEAESWQKALVEYRHSLILLGTTSTK